MKQNQNPEQAAAIRQANINFMIALALSFVTAMGLFFAGALTFRQLPWAQLPAAVLALASFGVITWMFYSSPVRSRKMGERYQAMSVAEASELFDAAKQDARGAAASAGGDPTAAAALLSRRISRAKWYFALLLGAAVIGSFCAFSGWEWSDMVAVPIVLAAFAVFYAFYYRLVSILRFRWDWSEYADPAETPQLHALARRAAEECGVRGKIRILYDNNASAGIAKVGSGKKAQYSLILGVNLLDILEEEELFCVLLHEFSHVSEDAVHSPTNNFFCSLLLFRDENTSNDVLGARFTRYHADLIGFDAFKYEMASSEFIERLADRGAVKRGDPKKFASAIVKTMMEDRFELVEDDYYTQENGFFVGETCREDAASIRVALFRRAYADHAERWFSGFLAEKQARNATHPIVRERLAAAGIDLADVTCALPDADADTPFRAEVRRVISLLDRKIAELNAESYEENRKSMYLDVQERLRTFDENGGKCDPTEYRQVISDLRLTFREKDAVALARSVIADESIDDNSKAFPICWLGCYLLAHDDPAGLSLAYRGADNNSNGIEMAIDAIGAYCCRNGLEEEYAEYRRRADQWLQYQHDVVEERVVLKPGDDLSEELALAPEKRDALREYILDAGEGKLRAVYLVHKTISPDPEGYASVVVLEYGEGASPEDRSDIYDRVFNYLDTVPDGWQYSLLEYNPEIARVLSRVPNSCIFRKES